VTVTRRARIIAIAIGFVAFASLARCTFDRLASDQQPRLFRDSADLFEIAKQPVAAEHLFQKKPFAIPLAYRVLDADPDRIASFQQELAVVAWCLFGLAACFVVRRTRARVAVGVVTLAFLFAPFRVGFSGAVLSESINDSLFALVCAAVCLLVVAVREPSSRARAIACAAVLAVLATLWLLARDTNAVTALAAILVAGIAWKLHRRREPWAIGLATFGAVAAVFTIWSSGVEPSPEVPARNTPCMINIVAQRIVHDAEARAFFEERGLPLAAEIASKPREAADPELNLDPRFAPARAWIAEEGRGVYARWLLRHPFARTYELVGENTWSVLRPKVRHYMPNGWHASFVRGVATTNQILLIVLLLAAIPLVRFAWAHPLARFSVVLLASGVFGAAASYYGDTIEIGRHCYAAGQQIVLGLFLAVIAFLDRPLTRV
jgi:hypothetical protein